MQRFELQESISFQGGGNGCSANFYLFHPESRNRNILHNFAQFVFSTFAHFILSNGLVRSRATNIEIYWFTKLGQTVVLGTPSEVEQGTRPSYHRAPEGKNYQLLSVLLVYHRGNAFVGN